VAQREILESAAAVCQKQRFVVKERGAAGLVLKSNQTFFEMRFLALGTS
jgi:hypothetical protein